MSVGTVDFVVINVKGDIMKTEVICQFKGIINGIEFNDGTNSK